MLLDLRNIGVEEMVVIVMVIMMVVGTTITARIIQMSSRQQKQYCHPHPTVMLMMIQLI